MVIRKQVSDPLFAARTSLGHVVVDDDVDALNVNAAPHQVSSHQDAFGALLELLVHLRMGEAGNGELL